MCVCDGCPTDACTHQGQYRDCSAQEIQQEMCLLKLRVTPVLASMQLRKGYYERSAPRRRDPKQKAIEQSVGIAEVPALFGPRGWRPRPLELHPAHGATRA